MQPESGLTTYSYDDTLNKMTMTRGGVTTTTVSDGLHRIKSKTYSDSTPQVTWSYDDPLVAYSRGRLTKVVSSAATRSILAYDALGRVLNMGQTVGTFTAPGISHTWNMVGLSSTTLPSARVVPYNYDGAGRVSNVSNGVVNYASSIQYAAHGAIASLARGDSVLETTTFSSRLQPVTIQAGSLLKLDYDYGGTANNQAGLNNNGNVLGQTMTRGSQQWAQAFGYDGVDRLTCANEVTGLTALPCGTGTPGWAQAAGAAATTAEVAAVSASSNVIGGFARRRADEALGYETPVDNATELTNIALDATTGAAFGWAGGKVADKLFPIPNVQREIALLRFAHRRSTRPARMQAAQRTAELKAGANAIVGGIAGGVSTEGTKWLWQWFTASPSQKEKKKDPMGRVCYEGGSCEVVQ